MTLRGMVLALGLAGASYGEQRMLETLLPRGGTVGTTVDVKLQGQYLEAPKEILFYDSCLKARDVKAGASGGKEVLAKIDIAPGCEPGEHVLRLRTATALSEPVTFWVSVLPAAKEAETKQGQNDTLAGAQKIIGNVTVEGEILPGAQMDVDVYRVEAKAGERVSVEVEAIRLGTTPQGGENDLMVRILDAEGREVAKNKDSGLFVQDPVLSVVAAKAGPYFVEIQQQVYMPVRLGMYRAHLGNFSRPLAVYPAGGRRGEKLAVKILGDPQGERMETVELPDALGDFAYRSGGAPSGNLLRVSEFPNVLEGETVPGLPVALNGILSEKGKADVFRFAAKKGETWKLRLFGRTLGSPIDPRIWIRSVATGKQVLGAEDARLVDLGQPSSRTSWVVKDSLDPVAVWTVTADGEYELGVEDTRGAGGPLAVYRVEIEPLKDAIYPHITMNEGYMIPRLTGMIVPRGNRWTMDVQLGQGIGNRYKGEVELEARGLPRGVKMIAPRFAKGATRMPVQFEASEEAETQAALVEIVAKPVEKNAVLESGTRQGFALINRGNEMPLHVVFLDRFAMAVTEPAPFHLELERPVIPLAQNGELALKVKVLRHGDFRGAVEIYPEWLPAGVQKGPVVTVKEGESEAKFTIQAGPKAPAGAYRIAMSGSTTGGEAFSGIGRVRVSSEFVDLRVAEPYVVMSLKRSAVERGQKGEIVAGIEQKHAFEGVATATLKNLPKGVRLVAPAKFRAKDGEVAFRIEADGDVLAGVYKDIVCEVTVAEKGETVKQQSGSGVLRVDPARGGR